MKKIIEDYTQNHPELATSAHFAFDRRISGDMTTSADIIVCGINPGLKDEPALCPSGRPIAQYGTEDYPDRAEDDVNDFITRAKQLMPEGMTSTLSEFFLWPSKDADQSFKKAYGASFASKEIRKHLEFVREMNRRLIAENKPKAVVAPGLSHSRYLAKLYNAKHIRDVKGCGDQARTLSHYELPCGTPMVFTAHWTGYRISNKQLSTIKGYVRDLVAA
jgi:hypothetical protein